MWVFKKPTNMVARIALTIISACILINAFIINPSDSHQSETNQQPAAETQQTENAPDGPKATLQSIEALYTGSTEAGTLIDSGADGMKVTATYSDGTSEEVTGWTIDHSEALVAGATSTLIASEKLV